MTEITVNRLIFNFTFREEKVLFLGPMLRGGLGFFLKRNLPGEKYRMLFETPTDARIMKLYPHAPKGFALKVPWQTGKRCRVEVRVFRDDEDVFSAIRDAFMYLAGQKRFLCRFEGHRPERIALLAKNESAYEGKFKVRFLTPTAVKYRGRFWREPEFHVLVRNLLRRIFLLGHFHFGMDFKIDFKDLIAQAEGVKIVRKEVLPVQLEWFSTRQRRRFPLWGFMGEVEYEGQISPELHSFLSSGELINAGRFTTYGMGSLKFCFLDKRKKLSKEVSL